MKIFLSKYKIEKLDLNAVSVVEVTGDACVVELQLLCHYFF